VKKINASFIYVVFLALLSVCSGSAFAEVKIGYVDVAKLSESAPQIRSAQLKMDAEFGGREKEIITLQQAIKAMEEAFERDSAVMSDSERSKKEKAILGKRRESKRAQEEFRDDINIRRNEILRKVNAEIGKAIEEYAKKNNFDLILSQGVMYSSDKVDITESVLKKLGGS